MERFPDNGSIHRGHAEYPENRRQGAPGFGRAQFLSEQVVNCRRCVCGQKPFGKPRFDRRPHCCARPGVRLPVQQNVQNHIGIHQDLDHRYFSVKCRLYASKSAFLRHPRRDRRIGGISRVAAGSETDLRYASTIRDTDTPRCFAYRLARAATAASTLKVNFDI